MKLHWAVHWAMKLGEKLQFFMYYPRFGFKRILGFVLSQLFQYKIKSSLVDVEV